MASESGSGEPEMEEEDGGDTGEKEEERDRRSHDDCSNYKREDALSARDGVGGFDFDFALTWRRRGEEIGWRL